MNDWTRNLTVGTADRERAVLRVVGEVDVNTAPQLRDDLAALIAADIVDIVVDLTGVTFIDSTGAGVLVAALKKVQARDGRLELVIEHAKVLRLFRIAALTRVFTIHPTVEAALAV